MGGILGLFVVAHLAVRKWAPRADATLLPLVALLLGIGFVTISRLDLAIPEAKRVAPTQALWTAVGVGAFVVTLVVVRRVRDLARYRYTFLLLGVVALGCSRSSPASASRSTARRLWARIGPLTVQPGEAAKVLLVVFFAAYLVEKRELLSSGSRRLGRMHLPDPKHLGPLLLPWILSIMILILQKDLGSSLLFFAVFVAMLYIATDRAAYLAVGAVLFAGAVAITYNFFGHVQQRIDTWIDPWVDRQGNAYQLVQSLYAFGSGGFQGTGIGLGRPDIIPVATTDFIFAAIGEELGLLGTVAVVIGFMLLVGSAFRIAVQSQRPFSKLFAAGLATILGVQTFVIIGGVTRLIPLTGVTLPFVSYGGSSLVANFVILALLMRISDENAAGRGRGRRARSPDDRGGSGQTVNRAIGRVGTAVIVLLLLLIGQLTYLQVIDANTLAKDPRNTRTYLKDFTRPRGEIISADGKILARSIPSKDEYEYQRIYPYGELFAQTVGYQSVSLGSTGVEREYSAVLSGRDRSHLRLQDLGDLLSGKQQTGNVVLSLRVDVQLIAKAALGSQAGSVVVTDPRTGALIAMYSNPSFDPQPLAGHNPKLVQADWESLQPNSPTTTLLPRAYRERYPPGSTFKIATTASALDSGTTTPTSTFPFRTSLLAPQAGQAISNFGGERCGGTLEQSFVESCNTTFAQLGLDMGEKFPPQLAGFGIYEAPPLDLSPGAAVSTGPVPGTFDTNKPKFALAGIGQGDVAATPLQMALVGSAVANAGTIMRPHVAAEIRDDEGRKLSTIEPKPWKVAMPATTAATIRDFMVQVVQHGTGTAGQIAGVTVAGKTGTAQSCEGCSPHAWFVAFAPAEAPQYAVSVFVERGGSMGNEATGGHVAAPIAAKILKYLLGK